MSARVEELGRPAAAGDIIVDQELRAGISPGAAAYLQADSKGAAPVDAHSRVGPGVIRVPDLRCADRGRGTAADVEGRVLHVGVGEPAALRGVPHEVCSAAADLPAG